MRMIKTHRIIVCAEKAAGANFVVVDKPTGDKQSSPKTTRKKLNTSHSGIYQCFGTVHDCWKDHHEK